MLSHREGAPFELSLARGGPFYRFARRAHLLSDDSQGNLRTRRLQLVCAVGTWLPLMLCAAGDYAVTQRTPMILRDLSVHARLLVAIPCYLFADRMLDLCCRSSVGGLLEGGYLVSSANALAAPIARAHRLRDSRIMEALFATIALAIGLVTLAQGSSGILDRMPHRLPLTAPRVFYEGIALPFVNFLLLRALWHWVLWVTVLASVARSDLQLVPLHADQCGGIKFLQKPANGFRWIGLGLTTTSAALWTTQILFAGATTASFQHAFMILVAGLVLLAFGPLFLFVKPLRAARSRGLKDCDQEATTLGRLFASRWFDRTRAPALMDTDDSSALIDYASSYKIVEKMRFVPVSFRFLATYLVVVMLPTVAVALAAVPMDRIVKLVARVIFGEVI
jgi:hypothetical protein